MRRVAIAAALVTIAIAGLLAAWFASGWSEVNRRADLERAVPTDDAARAGKAIAADLRAMLAAIAEREGARPYYHYQNLFHDPRAGSGRAVTPSPLAGAVRAEPMVLGYFQREADGTLTVPAINDDVPALSEPTNLVANRRFRDEVIRTIAPALGADASAAGGAAVAVDPETYLQNSNANVIFHQQNAIAPDERPILAAGAAAPVTITIGALAWRTLPYAGAPGLVATRTVAMPTGELVQGFVVDRAALTAWLAARAGDAVATLAPANPVDCTDDIATEVAPGWHLAVAANPQRIAAAAGEARALARGFVWRFVLVGIAALAAGALVVWIVQRAEKLARERSQFAAAAAHELRTPLAGLQLYGDMLADKLGDPAKSADYARRMSEEAARLGRVVSNVLGFSQLERGNLSVEPRTDALAEALRELAARAEPALDRAGATLALDVPAELAARFDRDAVARIVGNLLDNAEKYSRGAADRSITLAAARAGGVIEVVVSDRGPGVAKPGALFAPFTRGVDADGPAGLGLGLALSRSLARAMHGDLAYRAAPAGGAAFVLTLPVA